MRSPLGRVLGLGAAKEGTGHWWSQRLTAVALVPLVLWLVYSLILLAGQDHALVIQWLRNPVNAILLAVFLVTMFYHSSLGLQVVIGDYLHLGWLKIAVLVLVKFSHIVLAAAGVFLILRIALGSAL